MHTCRICSTALGGPDLTISAPALTSITTRLDVSTLVYVCRKCAHAQSPDLPDVSAFYANDYKISLRTEGFDQLYEARDDGFLFRTEHQTALIQSESVIEGARVLDFGCAKADTLRALFASRSDIEPHVFDVSDDYRSYWQGWVKSENQATHKLPKSWVGRFDYVTAHFVFEHIANPVDVLREVADCLTDDGRVFLTVPNTETNSGDLLVVDHLNHFSNTSIAEWLKAAHLIPHSVRSDRFRGAYVIVAGRSEDAAVCIVEQTSVDLTVGSLLKDLAVWEAATSHLERGIGSARNIAIYGAGFYGSFIANRLADRSFTFLDRNPYLQKIGHMGRAVLAPEACPNDIDLLIVALNPAHSKEVVTSDAAWVPKHVRLMYFGD